VIRDDILNVLNNELSQKLNSDIEDRLDHFLECIDDRFDSDDVLIWLQEIKDTLPAEVSEIDLRQVNDGWRFNQETGNLEHTSGGFFKVIGIKIETEIRESGRGWNQPIIDQGTEASVVGLIKKKINGISKYLIEAKFEPGNYDRVLLSPTLQVTYDNLNKLHSGTKPLFAEYFNGMGNVKFEHWYPEDGGRFYKKRVKNMLVEIDEDFDIPYNFMWVTMYQLKELLKMDNIMNPHLRSIISYL